MAHGNKTTRGSHHPYDVAFIHIVINMLDGSGKNPGMKALQAFFLTSF